MQGCNHDVQVLGIGHLAAAVRIELMRRGLHGEGTPGAQPLMLACSDFENPASFQETARLARQARAPLLMACLEAKAQPPCELAPEKAIKVVDRVVIWLAKAR